MQYSQVADLSSVLPALPAGVTTNIRLLLDLVEYGFLYKQLGTGDSSYLVHLDQALYTPFLDCRIELS